jgi:6-pyruvoyltetrahydropterin/6-carboxytetrahydropterin synthase
MLQVTKIFYFEMAHAIHGYSGQCKHIHGHSYELHITVSQKENKDEYIGATGFVIDFKELKLLVMNHVINTLDHKLVLSWEYVSCNPGIHSEKNLFLFSVEPSAENLLLHIKNIILPILPASVNLAALKLFETKDSFASWSRVHEAT